MKDFSASTYQALVEAKKLGGPWGEVQIKAVLKREFEAAVKERKKGAIHEGAEQVYALYPKHVGKDEALTAITKALKKHPLEYLLDKTNQFKASVESWPSSYRYMLDGGDRCPHPATWFNQGRFQDDPREWRRAGAKSAPSAKPVTASETTVQQEADAEALREQYRTMKEPEKGTLAHSLWLEGRRNQAVEGATAAFTGIVAEVEQEQHLRHA